jgi:hypothetical protein
LEKNLQSPPAILPSPACSQIRQIIHKIFPGWIYGLEQSAEMLYLDKTMTNISARDLRRAATIKDKIDSLQSELEKILGNGGSIIGNGRTAPKPDGRKTGRRKMSAAGRAKIAAAARARWAKVKAAGKKRL